MTDDSAISVLSHPTSLAKQNDIMAVSSTTLPPVSYPTTGPQLRNAPGSAIIGRNRLMYYLAKAPSSQSGRIASSRPPQLKNHVRRQNDLGKGEEPVIAYISPWGVESSQQLRVNDLLRFIQLIWPRLIKNQSEDEHNFPAYVGKDFPNNQGKGQSGWTLPYSHFIEWCRSARSPPLWLEPYIYGRSSHWVLTFSYKYQQDIEKFEFFHDTAAGSTPYGTTGTTSADGGGLWSRSYAAPQPGLRITALGQGNWDPRASRSAPPEAPDAFYTVQERALRTESTRMFRSESFIAYDESLRPSRSAVWVADIAEIGSRGRHAQDEPQGSLRPFPAPKFGMHERVLGRVEPAGQYDGKLLEMTCLALWRFVKEAWALLQSWEEPNCPIQAGHSSLLQSPSFTPAHSQLLNAILAWVRSMISPVFWLEPKVLVTADEAVRTRVWVFTISHPFAAQATQALPRALPTSTVRAGHPTRTSIPITSMLGLCNFAYHFSVMQYASSWKLQWQHPIKGQWLWPFCIDSRGQTVSLDLNDLTPVFFAVQATYGAALPAGQSWYQWLLAENIRLWEKSPNFAGYFWAIWQPRTPSTVGTAATGLQIQREGWRIMYNKSLLPSLSEQPTYPLDGSDPPALQRHWMR